MITRRGAYIRMLRGYVEDGLSDLGDFKDSMAYPVGDEGAEISVRVGEHDFTFYIGPGEVGGRESPVGLMAVTDNGRDRVRGPIDPTTWARISAFVRERASSDRQ